MKKLFNVFFDEDKGDGATGAGAGVTPPVTPTTPVTPAAGAEPKYTDQQLNDLIAKNVAKELKKAGVASLDELKTVVEKVKAAPAGDDPTKKELEEIKRTTGELSARADRNEATALALKAGVSDDATLERVVKLAMSSAYEGTIAERISKIVTEVPEFVRKPGQAFGVETKNESPDATASVLDQARARLGLKAAEPVKK